MPKMKIGNYLKSVGPGLVTIGYALQAAVADGHVSSTEWAGIGSLALATFSAWLLPKPAEPAQTVYVTPTYSTQVGQPSVTSEQVPPTI